MKVSEAVVHLTTDARWERGGRASVNLEALATLINSHEALRLAGEKLSPFTAGYLETAAARNIPLDGTFYRVFPKSSDEPVAIGIGDLRALSLAVEDAGE